MQRTTPNRLLIILFTSFILTFSIFSKPTICNSQTKQSKSVKTFYSKILEEERTIVIQLPEQYYSSKTNTFPVLYLLDAEGGYSWEKSILTVKELSGTRKIPDMILVGIHNTIRNRDMIPEKVSHRSGSGGSKEFLQFITKELVPYIESQFRINNFTI
jgi:uncharacterized protein